MSPIYLSVISIILVFYTVECAKILAVFPIPCISHQFVFRPFTQELARRGHEVTVVTTDPAFPKGETPENFEEIDLHESYALWAKYFSNIPTIIGDSTYDRVRTRYKTMLEVFEAQMNTAEVQKLLDDENKKFDLLILEASLRPAIGFSEKYKVPLILLSSFSTYHNLMESVIGPYNPLVFPDVTSCRVHNLSLNEKINLLKFKYDIYTILKETEEAETEMERQFFGPTVPVTSSLLNNIDLLMLNVHPLWDNLKPVPSSLVYLGGLPQKPDKELPKDLKSYLDASETGVVYVSFGTNVLISQIPKEKCDILLKVFSKLPYNVIWKWDDNELPKSPKNLKFGKWFPQSDLLKHPNVKLFITQGGLQSTDEAIAAGVPMIGIPMQADQWYNIEQFEKFGIGVNLNLENFTAEELLEALDKVLNDKSFRENIARFRSLVNDKPQSSLDRAVWWTEYLLRHGGKHLRSPAANMLLAEYLELDLVLILFVLLIVSVCFIKVVLRGIVNFVRNVLGGKLKTT